MVDAVAVAVVVTEDQAAVGQVAAVQAVSVAADAADVAVAPQVHSAVQVALHARARSPSVRSAMSTRSSKSMS